MSLPLCVFYLSYSALFKLLCLQIVHLNPGSVVRTVFGHFSSGRIGAASAGTKVISESYFD